VAKNNSGQDIIFAEAHLKAKEGNGDERLS
jgi:hypothetical protein